MELGHLPTIHSTLTHVSLLLEGICDMELLFGTEVPNIMTLDFHGLEYTSAGESVSRRGPKVYLY